MLYCKIMCIMCLRYKQLNYLKNNLYSCRVYEDDVAELKARQAEIWELLKVRQRDEL